MHVNTTMPAGTEIEHLNRALMAFTLLTGARDRAIASLKLKHVDLIGGCVHQDARELQTKFSKTFVTYFFPVGDEPLTIFSEWVSYLRDENLWGNDDPLFPATLIFQAATRQFEAVGLKKSTGAAPRLSERYSGKLLPEPASRILTLTASETPSSSSVSRFAGRRNSSRPGARIWATRKC